MATTRESQEQQRMYLGQVRVDFVDIRVISGAGVLLPVHETLNDAGTKATSSIHPMKRADGLEEWLAASVEDFDQWEAKHRQDDDV